MRNRRCFSTYQEAVFPSLRKNGNVPDQASHCGIFGERPMAGRAGDFAASGGRSDWAASLPSVEYVPQSAAAWLLPLAGCGFGLEDDLRPAASSRAVPVISSGRELTASHLLAAPATPG